MRRGFAATLLILAFTSLAWAEPQASVEPGPGTTTGADLLNLGPSEECGPSTAAPCPTLPDAPGDTTPRTSTPGMRGEPKLSTGLPAKGFTLSDLDGKSHVVDPKSLSKPVLVIFWSLFCEPCKEEFPMYGWLLEQYGPKGLDVVAVNIDGPAMATAAKRYMKMNGVPLKVLMDRKEGKRLVTAEDYGVTGTPSLFLIDKTGTVRWSHSGRISVEQIEAAIRPTLGS